jgi:hypothetical protein
MEEQVFLDIERSKNRSYNTCFTAGNCTGVVQSEETKAKRSAKLLGSKRTKAQRKRISDARKKVGITPEHQERLNQISRDRALRLTKAQAYKYALRHKNGETWQEICSSSGLGLKQLRREIKKHITDKSLLKPVRRDNGLEGESHPLARLTSLDVEKIILSKQPLGELAEYYGVTQGHLRDIKTGRTWRKVYERIRNTSTG